MSQSFSDIDNLETKSPMNPSSFKYSEKQLLSPPTSPNSSYAELQVVNQASSFDFEPGINESSDHLTTGSELFDSPGLPPRQRDNWGNRKNQRLPVKERMLLWKARLASLSYPLKWYCLITFLLFIAVSITIMSYSMIDLVPVLNYHNLARHNPNAITFWNEAPPFYFDFLKIEKGLASDPKLEKMAAVPRMYKMGYVDPKPSPDSLQGAKIYKGTKMDQMNHLKNLTENLVRTGLILFDYRRENKHVPRNYFKQYKEGECGLSKSFKDKYGLKIGSTVEFLFKESRFEKEILANFEDELSLDNTTSKKHKKPQLGLYRVKMKVIEFIDQDRDQIKPQFKPRIGENLFADINTFQKVLIEHRRKVFPRENKWNNYLAQINFTKVPSVVRVKLGSPKELFFFDSLQTISENVNRKIQLFENKFNLRYKAYFTYRIFEMLIDREQINTTISAGFAILVLVTVVLTGYLISTIFDTVIGMHTRDMATLKAIGLTRTYLIKFYFLQSALLGGTAFVLAYFCVLKIMNLINVKIFGTVKSSSNFEEMQDFSLSVSSQSLLYGLTAGIALPFLTSLIPLKIRGKSSIVDDLNTTRQKQVAVVALIKKLKNGSQYVSWTMIGCCLTACAFGYTLYLVFPYALLTQNFLMIAFIFSLLFILMGQGLIFICMFFERRFEQASYLFLKFEPVFIQKIVQTNLGVHRIMNRSLIWTLVTVLTCSNMIFLLLMANSESENKTSVRTKGTYIGFAGYLYLDKMAEHIRKYLPINDYEVTAVSRDFPETTPPENRFNIKQEPYISAHYQTNLGRTLFRKDGFKAILPNYHSVSTNQFESFESVPPTSLTPFEYLYTRWGHSQVIVSKYTARHIGLTCGKGPLGELSSDLLGYFRFIHLEVGIKMKCAAVANDVPGTNIKGFYRERGFQDILTDFPALFSLFDHVPQSHFWEINVWKLHFRPRDNVYQKKDKKGLEGVQAGSGVGFQDSFAVSPHEMRQNDDTDAVITKIFGFLNIMIYFLFGIKLFFSKLTQYLKTKQQIAILRSLGCTKCRIFRIYAHETFVLVFSASLMGFLISSIMTVIMTLQMEMFIDAVTTFKMPWGSLFQAVFFGMLIASAIGWLSAAGSKQNISTMLYSPN